MEFLDELIKKRIVTIKASLIAEEFANKEAFDAEIARLVNVMTSTAVINHISKEEASNYLQEHFVKVAEEAYVSISQDTSIEFPENYAFEEQQLEIEACIAKGKLEEADSKIENLCSILRDKDIVKDSINGNVFTQKDVDYFMNVAYPHFQDLKDEKIANMPEELNFIERIGRGVSFVFTGRNPYDNKQVKIKKEKTKKDSKAKNLMEWAKKHKVALTAAGASAILVGGIFIGSHFLHNKAYEKGVNDDLESFNQNDDGVEMATFEVDEFHNFNINDQETHSTKLKLLAQAFMERGIRVGSEEECMLLGNNNILAVSIEQLNNWLISMNLEDIDDLTFTKLMADSHTDKEELSSDFLRVSNILGTIYTTKEATPFIYEFIGNKEYSSYIKSYEEAMIQNQKGNQEALINLIKSRVYTPVANTSSGSLGMLSTSLVYQQANVYNARVIGQDIMNLYNINNDCKTDTTATFYSDDWAEYMRKLDSKFDAAIAYTGSESMAYIEYFKTLTDDQNDNKVVIENQALAFLKSSNIILGEWDLLDEIANDRHVTYQKSSSTGTTKKEPITNPVEIPVIKEIAKEPTTPEEIAVKEKTEKKLAEQNNQEFRNTVDTYPKENGKVEVETKEGDLVIYGPHDDQPPIIVDGDTMGAYDASKDYPGATYNGYKDYANSHQSQVQEVQGVGNVVVTEESKINTVVNPNVYQDKKGNIIDKVTEEYVPLGTYKEIQNIIDRNPDLSKWTTVEESDIHYSAVDDELPKEIGNESTYKQESDNNSNLENIQTPIVKDPASIVETPIYEDEDLKITVEEPIIQPPAEDKTSSILDNVDQDVYTTLSPEEQKELEEILNAGVGPVAGEVVEETFSGIVYGNYTVSQLTNKPELCKNVPESILKNEFPEIWSIYQNWLNEQNTVEAQNEIQEETKAVEPSENQTDISAQIAALEEVKTELTGEGLEATSEDIKTM